MKFLTKIIHKSPRALVVIIIAGVLFSLESPEGRYLEYRCQFRLTYGQQGKVDVAIFGNSRSQLAINTAQLQSELVNRKILAEDAVVYKLSRSFRGQEHQYFLARDLILNRKTNLILLEYFKATKFRRYHPRVQSQAKLSDLLKLSAIDTSQDMVIRISQVFRWVLERIALRGTRTLQVKLENLVGPDPVKAITTDCTNPDYEVMAEKNRSRFNESQGKEKITQKWNHLSNLEFITTFYTKEIIQLAREQGIKVILYFVPAYRRGNLHPDFVRELENYFQTSLYTPPDFLIEKIDVPGFYRDPSHLLKKGSRLYTQWLASALAENFY